MTGLLHNRRLPMITLYIIGKTLFFFKTNATYWSMMEVRILEIAFKSEGSCQDRILACDQGGAESLSSGEQLQLHLVGEEPEQSRSDSRVPNMWSDLSTICMKSSWELFTDAEWGTSILLLWIKALERKNTSAQAKEHFGTPKQNGIFDASNMKSLQKNHTQQAKENTQ